MIRARVDGLNELKPYFDKVARAQARGAVVGLNRAATRVRALSSAEIRDQVALPKNYVDRELKINKLREDNPAVEIASPKRGTLLVVFPNRQLRRQGRNAGVSVKVKPRGGFKQMREAFYVPAAFGNRGATKGRVIAVRPAGSTRYPIKVLYGPSVSQVFQTVRDDIAPRAVGLVRTEVERAQTYLIKEISR